MHKDTHILRLPDLLERMGLSRSTIYQRVSEGLFPPPVELGPRARGWPDYEVELINRAAIEGYSTGAIRELVKQIIDKRKPQDKGDENET